MHPSPNLKTPYCPQVNTCTQALKKRLQACTVNPSYLCAYTLSGVAHACTLVSISSTRLYLALLGSPGLAIDVMAVSRSFMPSLEGPDPLHSILLIVPDPILKRFGGTQQDCSFTCVSHPQGGVSAYRASLCMWRPWSLGQTGIPPLRSPGGRMLMTTASAA